MKKPHFIQQCVYNDTYFLFIVTCWKIEQVFLMFISKPHNTFIEYHISSIMKTMAQSAC